MNLYGYVGNDPIDGFDPMGLCTEFEQLTGLPDGYRRAALCYAVAVLAGAILAPFIIEALFAVEATETVLIIGEYEEISALSEAGELEAHHILETRFLTRWGYSSANAPAVLLARAAHVALTEVLRRVLLVGFRADIRWNFQIKRVLKMLKNGKFPELAS